MCLYPSIDKYVSFLKGDSKDKSFISLEFMGYRDVLKNLYNTSESFFNQIENKMGKMSGISYEYEDSHVLLYYTIDDNKYISKIRFDNLGLINSQVEEIYNPNNSQCVLLIEYDGTNYYGMQRQKSSANPTIQGELEKALKTMLKKDVIVYPASRTDRGVHAKGQVVHFLADSIEASAYKYALNNILPKEIRIKDAYIKSQLFNSRYDSIQKTYNYIVESNTEDAFLKNYVCFYKFNDLSKIEKELKELVGTHDFCAFSKGKKDNTVRTIYDASITITGSRIIFSFTGDGFLHNMIRFIMGSLIEIDKKREGSIKYLIEKKDKNLTPHLAPAQGLYLMEIKY